GAVTGRFAAGGEPAGRSVPAAGDDGDEGGGAARPVAEGSRPSHAARSPRSAIGSRAGSGPAGSPGTSQRRSLTGRISGSAWRSIGGSAWRWIGGGGAA